MQSVVLTAHDGISSIRKFKVLSHPSYIWKLLEWRLCHLQVRSRGPVQLQALLEKQKKKSTVPHLQCPRGETQLPLDFTLMGLLGPVWFGAERLEWEANLESLWQPEVTLPSRASI